jgi:hypothetical protein
MDELPGFSKEDLKQQKWHNLLKDERVKLAEDNGKGKIFLEPYEIMWLAQDPDQQ